MVRKVLYPAVFVLAMLMVSTAYGNFYFQSVYTFDPIVDGYDGRIYDQTGAALVQDGALVQFIVAIDGAAIVDPIDYFDGTMGNGNGAVDGAEVAAVTAWLNAGADPAAISGGTNVLCYDLVTTPFTGEFETVGGKVALNGQVDWQSAVPPWDPLPMPVVQNGMGGDLLAYRAWNLTKADLEEFCTVDGVEAWYMTNTERGFSGGNYPPADLAMIVGAGNLAPGADPIPPAWTFDPMIGIEVIVGLRPLNSTDTHLLTCVVPEPSTMLLIGSSVLLLLIRRKK